MQFLRRLSLVDYALFLALLVAGALAIASQRDAATTAEGGGSALSVQDRATFEAARGDLFEALADGRPADAPFAAMATAVAAAGDVALAAAITELGAAHAMRSEAGISAALRTINGLVSASPFAAPVIEAYASGTLRFGLDGGPATPATGREWVHLVWFETETDAFDGWDIATGEAIWTVEAGNAAVSLAFTVAGQSYSGTLRLAPAGPGALVEATATLSIPVNEIVVALGEAIPEEEGILILDLGEGAQERPGQPWRGETRLGEPADLIDQIRDARAIGWLASLPDGRNFFMRIKLGETGRAAITSVFPA